jgi:hypothetical protein
VWSEGGEERERKGSRREESQRGGGGQRDSKREERPNSPFYSKPGLICLLPGNCWAEPRRNANNTSAPQYVHTVVEYFIVIIKTNSWSGMVAQ